MAQQQVQKTRTAVKRIDECAKVQEAQQHEQMMSNARRAAKKARQAVRLANNLLSEINKVV